MLALAATLALLAAPQESWSVTGHIASKEGDLLIEGWEVRCTVVGADDLTARTRKKPVDPELGTFAFDGLVEPVAFVSAHHRATGVSIRAVECRPGAANVILRLDGPAPAELATLVVDNPWLDAGLALSTRHLRVVGSLGDRPALRRDRLRTKLAWLAPLGARGTYTLGVTDPRFEHIEQLEVARGGETQVVLRGAAKIDLEVLGANGERLTHVDVTAVRAFGGSGRASVTLARRSAPLNRGRLSGLLPGDVVLQVRAAGHAPAETRVLGLTRDVTPKVTLQLEQEACLQGRVSPSVIAPMNHPTVFALPVDANLDHARWLSQHGTVVPDHPLLRRVIPASDGTFRIAEAQPGRYRIWCAPNAWTHIEAIGGEKPVTLELPATGSLEGRVIAGGAWVVRPRRAARPQRRAIGNLPGSAALFPSTQVFTFSSSTSADELSPWMGPAPAASPVDARFLGYAELDDDGRFAIPLLPAGELELELAPASPRVGVPIELGVAPRPLGSVEIVADERLMVVERAGTLVPEK